MQALSEVFWRCSRYLAVQEASSGQLVSGGAGGRLLVIWIKAQGLG